MRLIVQTWWPLVASTLLDAIETPVQLAVLARLSQSEINLAAYSGVVRTLAITIAAPASFLLPAAIALGRGQEARRKLRCFSAWLGGIATAVHALVAFTPLYDLVVGRWIGVPAEIIAPARLGMMLMTPWAWIVACRSLNQGLLIRSGQARDVSSGTLLRLGVGGVALWGGCWLRGVSGILVVVAAALIGAAAQVAFLVWRVQRAQKAERDETTAAPLTWRALLAFYLPLALTELISVPVYPLRSAALSRMPFPLDSLAVYSVVYNIASILASAGRAYHDVVVALLSGPRAMRALSRFALGLAGALTLLLAIVAATPLAEVVLARVAALPASLIDLARWGLWAALLYPGLLVFHSLVQGVLVRFRLTRGVPEGLVVYLLTSSLVLGLGVIWRRVAGLYVVWLSIQLGFLAETIWMWRRGRVVWQESEVGR